MSTTWNPSDKGAAVTLSGGNLSVAVTGPSLDGVRTTVSKTSAKWYFELTVPTTGGTSNQAVGIADSTWAVTSVALGSDTHGICFRPDGLVRQNSVTRGTYTAWSSGDVIGVAFEPGVSVKFYRNNTLIHTETTNIPVGGTWFPAYSGDGAGVTRTDTANFGATALTYTPPSGYTGIDSATLDFTHAMTGGVTVGSDMTFFPPPSWPMTGGVSVGSAFTLFFKAAFLHQMTGGVTVGSDTTVTIDRNTLVEALPIYTLECSIVGGNTATGDNLLALHTALGGVLTGEIFTLAETLPAYALAADFGWFSQSDLPAYALNGLGVVGEVAFGGRVLLPAYTIDATLNGSGGMDADNAFPVYVVSASGLTGQVGTAALLIPAHRLLGTGTSGSSITAANTLPVYVLVGTGFAAYSLDASITLPMWQLDAAMSASIVAAYRTWVLNLKKRALTEYTNFNFNSFAPCEGQLFAAGPNGIFNLSEQDLDDTAAIDATIRTGKHNLGTSCVKRVPRIYAILSTAGAMEFRTITAADGRRGYLLTSPQTLEVQQRRVPVGRGPKASHWQFEVLNRAGADFALEGLLLYPETTRRRVGG